MPPLPLNTTTKIARAERLAVFGASLASLSGLALLPAQAAAQSQAQYQIAPGPLGSALTRHALLSDFIREQHRHCKPILALGESGPQWLEALGLPLLLHGERPDPALIVEGTPADDPVARFVAALQRHRHHERELDLLLGTTP